MQIVNWLKWSILSCDIFFFLFYSLCLPRAFLSLQGFVQVTENLESLGLKKKEKKRVRCWTIVDCGCCSKDRRRDMEFNNEAFHNVVKSLFCTVKSLMLFWWWHFIVRPFESVALSPHTTRDPLRTDRADFIKLDTLVTSVVDQLRYQYTACWDGAFNACKVFSLREWFLRNVRFRFFRMELKQSFTEWMSVIIGVMP